MERVTALGWADELSKMRYPDRFRNDPYIQKICQKEITGRGNFFQSTQCYILLQVLIVLLHLDEFYQFIHGRCKRQASTRGT